MQTKKYQIVFAFIALGVTLFSCRKPEPDAPEDATYNVWVLNEGIWNMNNAGITAYNTSTQQRLGDIYQHVNRRGLGDVANDILVYGSKAYIVVNNSNRIDVVDKNTGVSIKQISGSASQPRCLAACNGKIYASYYSGVVAKIDTALLQIEATVSVGRNPDGICAANNKLYVCNSGGLDFPNRDNTVSVIDLDAFSEIKKISVRINPTSAKANRNEEVYVVSNGNYEDIPPCLQRINVHTDEVEKTFELEVVNFDIYNNAMYFYTYNYSTQKSSYQIFDLQKESITNTQFLSGTLPKTPYGIYINQSNGEIYITDALDYSSTGDVYCFHADGTKKFSFEAGRCPKKVVIK
ncbi:MAG: hypothetical protein LBH82_03315 [Bacteroidales bacterium]|jgi:DNA-binding beta-propeller fold protein YncE|nr:hypothetical protein [Bacteroidales bacterium]